MQRKERAKVIRKAVMREIEHNGKWTDSGGARHREVETGTWGAMLFTPFGTPHRPPIASNEAQALYLQNNYAPPKSYQIDVWTKDRGKVISFEWSDDVDIRIISMQRGTWEQELFALP